MSNILDEILTRLESVEEKLDKVIEFRMNEHGLDRFKFVRIEEAAEILNISVHTIYQYTCKRRIRYSKSGNQLYFKIEDLNEFIEKGRVDPKPSKYR